MKTAYDEPYRCGFVFGRELQPFASDGFTRASAPKVIEIARLNIPEVVERFDMVMESFDSPELDSFMDGLVDGVRTRTMH